MVGVDTRVERHGDESGGLGFAVGQSPDHLAVDGSTVAAVELLEDVVAVVRALRVIPVRLPSRAVSRWRPAPPARSVSGMTGTPAPAAIGRSALQRATVGAPT